MMSAILQGDAVRADWVIARLDEAMGLKGIVPADLSLLPQ